MFLRRGRSEEAGLTWTQHVLMVLMVLCLTEKR